MLELRPNCEYCDVDLPPASPDPRICSYECTFCASCVEDKLHNVCPNCGGGLVPRPIRPRLDRRPNTSLVHQPASTDRRSLKWTHENIAEFCTEHRDIPPADR